MNLFYIICKRHAQRSDYAVLFWGKNFSGYTYNLNNAGLYTEQDVANRFKDTNPSDDLPVHRDFVEPLAVDMVIGNKDLGKVVINNPQNRKKLNIKVKEMLTGPSAWDSRSFCKPTIFLQRNQNTLELIEAIRGKFIL